MKRRLDAAFLNVVDVEPMVDDFFRRDEFSDVVLQEDLKFVGHFADALVAHAIVPDDDFFLGGLFCVFLDPGSDCFVVCSAFYEFFELVAADAGELKEHVIEWAGEVVFAVGVSDHCAAFVEDAGCDDVAADDGTWAAWKFFGEIWCF